ncbi:MAG TPA: hypothetical protein VMG12_01450 [Polyangiaceae bacterium]|nr:hypothetical protein [Polyangiaceae bacterium]
MKRTKWNPRKLLIASAGVASVNYALAAGCSSSRSEVSVANLMPCPPSQCPDVGGNGGAGPTVANLVAPPPGGSGGDGGFAGASVANLVAPPPGGMPNVPDASTPDPNAPDASPDDAGARDAAPDGAA